MAQTAGIYQEDEGGALNVDLDLMQHTTILMGKVRASNKLPQSSIEQMTVITGGLQYGDATGGLLASLLEGLE